jgi:predicted Zn-dependent protease
VTLYQKTQRLPEALDVCQQLIGIDPGCSIYHVQAGMTNLRLNRLPDAEAAFKRAVQVAPDRFEGYAALAQFYLATERELLAAKTQAAKAVELAPVAQNYYLLFRACRRTGDSAGAAAAIEQALKLEPGNPEYQQIRESMRREANL